MKAIKKSKDSVYYRCSRNECWKRGYFIKTIALIISLIFVFSTIPAFDASAAQRSVSRSLTTSIYILPKGELNIDASKIEKVEKYLDSEDLSNVFSENKNDGAAVTRLHDGCTKTILVTKICD